jgi:hypothetical protein
MGSASAAPWKSDKSRRYAIKLRVSELNSDLVTRRKALELISAELKIQFNSARRIAALTTTLGRNPKVDML